MTIWKTVSEAKEASGHQALNKMLEKEEIKKEAREMKTEKIKPISYNTIKKNTSLDNFFEKKEELKE